MQTEKNGFKSQIATDLNVSHHESLGMPTLSFPISGMNRSARSGLFLSPLPDHFCARNDGLQLIHCPSGWESIGNGNTDLNLFL